MASSIFQVSINHQVLWADFHPLNNAIIVLLQNGRLQCFSPEGELEWEETVECRPVTFRINSEGHLLVLLGEGVLVFFDLWTRQGRDVVVDERYRLLELYKSCAVLGGYMEEMAVFTPGGKEREKIVFDELVRQFCIIPDTEKLIVLLQNNLLACTDMQGRVEWEADGIMPSGDILVGGDGLHGYFKNLSGELVRFDVSGDGFYLVSQETPPGLISLSPDGQSILILDADCCLSLFDSRLNRRLHFQCRHALSQMKISQDNSRFFTIDDDGILTCYLTSPFASDAGDFFELKENRRVDDVTPAWEETPGHQMPNFDLRMLRVNNSGTMSGLIGRNGNVHFLDEGGVTRCESSLPSPVIDIGISDDNSIGYISGRSQITIVDIGQNQSKLILNEQPFFCRPIVNYHHQRIFLITSVGELAIKRFNGTTERTLSIVRDCDDKITRGISCERDGVMMLHNRGMIGYSKQGKVTFAFSAKAGMRGLTCGNSRLFGLLNNSAAVFSVNLKNGDRKKTALKEQNDVLKLISGDPVLVAGEKTLYRMDKSLSITNTWQIRSASSLFFMDHDRMYEIVKQGDTILCYDDQHTLWRYKPGCLLSDWALTENGLLLLFKDCLQYIVLRKSSSGAHQPHFSEFLEL